MTTITINDDGTVDGYIPLTRYAKQIGITDTYARTLINRGKLPSLSIEYGNNGFIHLIKEGTKPLVNEKKGRPRVFR